MNARFLAFAGFLLAMPSFACSVAFCSGRGMERAPSFTVALHRDGRPLSGARLTISGKGGGQTATTGPDGTFRFHGLPPGDDYSLHGEYLGLSVAFHVRKKPSPKARGSATFSWDVQFLEVSQIAGPISDSNRWRTPNLPIPAVGLHLLDVWTGDRVSSSRSGNDGLFAFSYASAGEYLLVAEAGQGPSGIAFDESRMLVRLLPFAAKQQISLRLMNSTCGAHLYSQ